MEEENISVGNELEEEYIPNSNNTLDDDELDDVIPCEIAGFEEQEMDSMPIYADSDNLFNGENSYIPTTVPTSEMVDISNHENHAVGNELEEEYIPNSNNTIDDDELDDVTLGEEMV